MDGEDRISLLPDCLLLEIISRIKLIKNNCACCYDPRKENERLMSTKEVIRTTSTLSKRWQHLWTLFPDLIFIEHNVDVYERGNGNKALNVYFLCIDKTLTQCPTHVNLNSFILNMTYNGDFNTLYKSQVYSWIRYAITRNVQEVQLMLWDTHYPRKLITYDDDLFFNNSCFTRLKLAECVLHPPVDGIISWSRLKCLCILRGKLDEDMIENILSGSPCLETLELSHCYGFRQIDITSKSVKNFLLSGYANEPTMEDYINTIEINAPYILSLTIEDELYCLQDLLLLNVTSLVKTHLNYHIVRDVETSLEEFAEKEEEFFEGLLQSLGHVKEFTFGDECLPVLSRLEAKGFQFFEGDSSNSG